MTRKPMLFSTLQGRGCHREVIGLIGAHPGSGVTYTGLLLSFYLGEELGRKTAYAECNGHQDFWLFQQAYQWRWEEEHVFSFGNITFYRNVTAERIPSLLGENYDVIILDFGYDLNANREEFGRCDKKLVLGGCTEWNLCKLGSFIENVLGIKGNETWNYLLPFAGKKTIQFMQQKYNRKFYPIPLESDPLKLSKEAQRLFLRLLE